MTRFEELVCSSDMARAVLSACNDNRGWFWEGLYNWQTLISGGLAVLAALATVVYVRRQIALQREQVDLQRDQYQQENRQRVKAALIRVPHALVEIHSYLVDSFAAWKAEKPDERPKPPFSALEVIMNAAAYVDDESFDSFRHLVISSQTFETRIASPGRQRAHNTLSTMIVDLAELSYLTTRLFRFSRMEDGAATIPYIKPTRTDLEEALDRDFDLKLLLEDDPIRERLTRAMRQRFPSSLSPSP